MELTVLIEMQLGRGINLQPAAHSGRTCNAILRLPANGQMEW